jgi:hypothetical protein
MAQFRGGDLQRPGPGEARNGALQCPFHSKLIFPLFLWSWHHQDVAGHDQWAQASPEFGLTAEVAPLMKVAFLLSA